jgi:uncharacterized protein (TIGR02996 family)
MSLQTPRVLAEQDVELLRSVSGAEPARTSKEAASKAAKVTKEASKTAKVAKKASKTAEVAKKAAKQPQADSLYLSRALDALNSGDRAGALDALLDAWSSQRHPEIAELIEKLGADIDRSLPAIEGKRDALSDAWLDVAASTRSVDMGRLLDAGIERASAKQLRQLIPILLGFKPDPRTSRVVELLARYTSSGATPALTQALNLLAHVQDPRVKQELSRYTKTSRSWLEGVYRKATKVAAALPEAPPLSASDRQAVKQIKPRLAELAAGPPADPESLLQPRGSGDETGARLLEAVLDKPDDDGNRLVYADWLLERGDPRGELIQLQFKRHEGGLGPGEAKQERALLKAHAAKWIGAVALVAKDLHFERGFLHGCRVMSIKTDKQKMAVRDPNWATVCRLVLDERFWEGKLDELSLLRQAPLRSLEALENASAKTLASWLRQAPRPRLRELRISIDEVDDSWRELCKLAAGTVRRLWIEPAEMSEEWGLVSGYGWLYDSPLGQGLEQLTIGWDDWIPPVAHADRVLDRLPGLRRVRFHAAGGFSYEREDAELLAAVDRQEGGNRLAITLTRPFETFEPEDGDHLRHWVRPALEHIFGELPRPELPIKELELSLHRPPSKRERQKLRQSLIPLVEGKFDRVIFPDGPL